MILGVLFALVMLTVPLFRGRLGRLGEIKPVAIGTVIVALVIQFVIVSVIPTSLPLAVASVLHLGSYGLVLIFVWKNRSIPGMAILVAGGLMNLAAIAANGGVMPASATALETAGKLAVAGEFKNSNPQDNARLQILGDIFAIPDGYPFANVFSVGDVLLVVGGAITVHKVGGSALARRGRIDMRRRVEPFTPETTDSYKLQFVKQRSRPGRAPRTISGDLRAAGDQENRSAT